MANKGTTLLGMILVLVAGASLVISQPSLAQCQVFITGLNDISIPESAFSYNPVTRVLEGSGSDAFRVIIVCLFGAQAQSGSVDITSVTCPITGQTQPGSSAGYLSADLSRYDLELPEGLISVTNVTLTVSTRVPLTVPPGTYSGGLVEITATVTF